MSTSAHFADSTAITKLADGREGEGMVGEVWGPT